MLALGGLTRRFGDVQALDGLSFSVAPGRICGFLGPNGAGKTTAMRIVMGVTTPDAGEVAWRGAPVTDAVRRRFGYMPEERGLYAKMRVRDQLVYLARLHGLNRAEAGRRADRWIEEVGLAERAGDRVLELSQGNQQRVQLAAALVHDPELLVLDEPFAGLDPLGVDRMSALLREGAATGAAVVFSSHQLDLVEDLCDDVAIVHRGRAVLRGPVAELKRRGRRRVVVELAQADPGLGPAAAALVGVRPVAATDRSVTVELEPMADDRQLVELAMARGRLVRFAEVTPRLSELFRQAVGSR